MKRLLTLILILSLFGMPVFSQVFENYRVVVRNSQGQLLTDKAVTLKLEVLENSAYGSILYAEVFRVSTNSNGEAVLDIGAGKGLHGSFQDVQNNESQLFIKTFIDLNNGISFMEMEPDIKTSIPYALYAGCFALGNLSEEATTAVSISGMIIDFDGNTYPTVTIGEQTWLAANLKSEHYADGRKINHVYDYQNNASVSSEYGKLYSWDAAMDGKPSSVLVPSRVQGVCPDGFHVPSAGEWEILKRTINEQYNVAGAQIGLKLKENGSEHWNNQNGIEGNNDTGFTALGAGCVNHPGSTFLELKEGTSFWSASEYPRNKNQAYRLKLYDSGVATTSGAVNKTTGFSVRCVMD